MVDSLLDPVFVVTFKANPIRALLLTDLVATPDTVLSLIVSLYVLLVGL
jgi:hypothetical protein